MMDGPRRVRATYLSSHIERERETRRFDGEIEGTRFTRLVHHYHMPSSFATAHLRPLLLVRLLHSVRYDCEQCTHDRDGGEKARIERNATTGYSYRSEVMSGSRAAAG